MLKQAAEGRADEINTCIGCNQACLDHIFLNKRASCLVNPVAAHETELLINPVARNKVRTEYILCCASCCVFNYHSMAWCTLLYAVVHEFKTSQPSMYRITHHCVRGYMTHYIDLIHSLAGAQHCGGGRRPCRFGLRHNRRQERPPHHRVRQGEPDRRAVQPREGISLVWCFCTMAPAPHTCHVMLIVPYKLYCSAILEFCCVDPCNAASVDMHARSHRYLHTSLNTMFCTFRWCREKRNSSRPSATSTSSCPCWAWTCSSTRRCLPEIWWRSTR